MEIEALVLLLRNAGGRLAADIGDLALEVSHAGLAGIGADDAADGVVLDLELRGLEAVLFALLRDQVALCDLELFLVGVAVELDDLHAVEQGAWDRRGGVRGGDEEHTGQIKRQLEEVIAKAPVLLSVQSFEQGRCGVAAVVGGKLVDLVEHHQGIAGLGLNDAADDAPGHGADVGAAVTADLGLVMHTAEGDAHELSVRGGGNALGNAGLAGARRTDKAEKPALDIGAQLLDGKVFEDALLDLLEAEVVVVQLLAGFGDIDGLLRGDAPGDLQADVQVVAQYGRLGRAEGLLGEPAQLLVELLAHLVRDGQGLDLLAVELNIVVLAELRLDDLHLLAQVVVPLVAVHSLLGLVGKLLLDAQDAELSRKQAVNQRKAARGIALLQKELPVLHAQAHVLGKVVGDIGGLRIGEQVQKLLVDHIAVILDVLLKLV